jgi:hypothetical protein
LIPSVVPEILGVLLELFHLEGIVAVVVSVDEHGGKLELKIATTAVELTGLQLLRN